jgi:hypothetical protein
LQLGLQSIGASGIVASHVGQEAPRAVEQADAVGERHRGVFEFLVDREDGLHALLGGPTRPAVERLGAGAAGDLREGDEALLRDVELAAQAPVVGFEEVAGVVGGRNLGRDLLASILTALVGPGALPDFEQNCPPLERARPRAAHSDLGQAFGSLRLAHRALGQAGAVHRNVIPHGGRRLALTAHRHDHDNLQYFQGSEARRSRSKPNPE